MIIKSLEEYSLNDVFEIFKEKADAILFVNAELDCYKSVSRKGIFLDIINESGVYHDLIEKLVFHFSNSTSKIINDYQVFAPLFGRFNGKYSRRIKLLHDNSFHIVQMTIYPLDKKDMYMLILDELDESESVQEFLTNNKLKNIENIYLYSMYVDLINDTIHSINISEISDEPMHATDLKYTGWRNMIVNMIWPDDQSLFLERSDPDYLKKNLAPGRTMSFDCQMKNLQGKYIWVKLIFGRAETSNNDDFRFVFMVQDIHENVVELMSTLKLYEELATKDSLTGVYNRGRIEIELNNAIKTKNETEQPISIMMIDIDNFKKINDTHGHTTGDTTLKYFTSVICNSLKDYDIKVGRWGGDEFIAVCYGISSSELMAIAKDFILRISNVNFNAIGQITCSIGLTELKKNDRAEEAFERVDKAMYSAKYSGKNPCSFN